jgi:hypothetical protein
VNQEEVMTELKAWRGLIAIASAMYRRNCSCPGTRKRAEGSTGGSLDARVDSQCAR